MTDPSPAKPQTSKRTFQAPKGTRDFYPQDLLRRRYIIDAWRRVSLRHGFEEIDGPTFEDAELYTVKSGEGILGELFGAYSGKDPREVEQVKTGTPPFALRPEFTPTLARMYAAKAKGLPQPTKWFCVSNFFRAERPQRGRLREFWQWNVDVLGQKRLAVDVELLATHCACFADLGLSPKEVSIRLSHRTAVEGILAELQIPESKRAGFVELLDRRAKLSHIEAAHALGQLQLEVDSFDRFDSLTATFVQEFDRRSKAPLPPIEAFAADAEEFVLDAETYVTQAEGMIALMRLLGTLVSSDKALIDWVKLDLSVVRGLAYYTGTVFEAHELSGAERAVAGGGRYDKLIELFGGPPTPAVGFGMGDVVLTNLLDDRKLMPEGRDLLEACSRPLPVRPDVFVIANEKDESQAQLVPLVAALRRGVESQPYLDSQTSDDTTKRIKPWSPERYTAAPLHARRSYKTTKNIGKLLSDATSCHAQYAFIIEDGEKGTLKNLDTGEQTKDVLLGDVASRIHKP